MNRRKSWARANPADTATEDNAMNYKTSPTKRVYKVRYRAGASERSVMVLAGSSDEAENLVLDDHPGAAILDVRKVYEKRI